MRIAAVKGSPDGEPAEVTPANREWLVEELEGWIIDRAHSSKFEEF